jgi:hypothetical protein
MSGLGGVEGIESSDQTSEVTMTSDPSELCSAGTLYRTLRTTNPIENLNGSLEYYTRAREEHDSCQTVRPLRDTAPIARWGSSPQS